MSRHLIAPATNAPCSNLVNGVMVRYSVGCRVEIRNSVSVAVVAEQFSQRTSDVP